MRKYILLLPLLLFSTALAKSYYYDSINVNVTMLENGDLQVVEEQTIVFDGSFSYVYRLFYEPAYNFRVSDETGYLSHEKDGKQYTWRGSWTDTTKTFRLEYLISEAFTIVDDNYRLHYTLVFYDRDVPVRSSTSYITAPVNINGSTIRSVPGSAELIDNKTIKVTSGNLLPHQALDLEVIIPNDMIHIPMTWNMWVQANEYWLKYVTIIPFFLIIAYSATAFTVYKKFEKLKKKDKAVRVRVEDLPPAMAGYMTRLGSTTKEVIATIIDLAVRGYIFIHKVEKAMWFDETYLVKTKSTRGLNDYEKKIMDVIFSTKDKVKMMELRKKFNPPRIADSPLTEISELIEKQAEKLRLIDEKPEKIEREYSRQVWKPPVISFGLIFIYVAIGFISFTAMDLTPFLVMLFLTFLSNIIIIAVTMTQMGDLIKITPKGKGARIAYKELKKFILESPLTEGRVFDTYLPHAIALGVQKKWVRKAEELDYKADWHSANLSTASIIVLTSSMSSSVSPSSGGAGGGGVGGGGGAGGGGGGAG